MVFRPVWARRRCAAASRSAFFKDKTLHCRHLQKMQAWRRRCLSILWHRSAARTDTIRPFFPCSGGLPRVGNQRIPGGIIEIFRFGLQWKDTPKEYWQIEPVMPVLSDGAEWGLRKEFYGSFRTYPGDLSSSLKGWRRITMRYALCAHAFLSTIHMSILSDGYRE